VGQREGISVGPVRREAGEVKDKVAQFSRSTKENVGKYKKEAATLICSW